MSSLQTSLTNLSSLLTSRLGPSLGTETPQTSLPLSTPSLSLPSFQTNDEDRSFGEQRVYPTEVEVLIENIQVENRSPDVSMEEDLGSEEHVLSTNPLPPPLSGLE